MNTTPETRLLKAVCTKELTGIVRQEPVVCKGCGRPIDVMGNDTDVRFTDIEVGDKKYTLMDPTCPECGTHNKAEYSVSH